MHFASDFRRVQNVSKDAKVSYSIVDKNELGMKDNGNWGLETSFAWKIIPSWLVELWIVFVLAEFFFVRVIGSSSASQVLHWYQRLK